MKDERKIKEQLINELVELRQRITELEALDTERKQAEEALREREERFGTLFEKAAIGIALIELDLPPIGEESLAEYNPAMQKFFGYSEEELRSVTVAELSHPEDLKKDIDLLNELLAGKRDHYDMEKRFVRKDGQLVWGHLNVTILRGAEGKPTHVLSTVNDITEHKQAEAQLHYQANLLENVSDAIISTDMDFVVQSWNKAAEVMYGWKVHEVLGNPFGELVKPEYPDDPREAIIQEFIENGYYEGEVIHHRKDGTPITVWGSVSMLKDCDGNALGAVSVNRDITERKRAEEALRVNQAELSAVFDNAPIVMILVDRERRVRKANHSAVEFTGRPAEEMIGLRGGEALRCLHSLDDPRGCGFGPFCEICAVRNTVLDTFETGKGHHQVEASLPFARREEREELTFLVSTTLLNISKDQMVLVCVEDITERKRMEETRDRLILELQDALAQVKTLSGLIPICASCKKIRDDEGFWNQLEVYISEHSEAEFTHGICPECEKKLYPELYGGDG